MPEKIKINDPRKSAGCDKIEEHDNAEDNGISQAEEKLIELFHELFAHRGYGQLEVFMRILKRGQKEIVLRMGKEFRFVVNYRNKISSHETDNNYMEEPMRK